MNIAVFISGTGRTLLNLLLELPEYTICCVVTTNRNALRLDVLQLLHRRDIPLVDKSSGASEMECVSAAFFHADLICLAGFLKKLQITDGYEDRVLNIHPSLIPAFCGEGMYGNKVHDHAIASGVQYSGCTVHFCDPDYDTGAIILQRLVKIQENWDSHALADAVFEQEKIAYPIAIRAFGENYERGKRIDLNRIIKQAREIQRLLDTQGTHPAHD